VKSSFKNSLLCIMTLLFEETSVKVKESGVFSDRLCYGFSPKNLDHSVVREFVGEENYQRFAELFPKALYDPESYSSIMFGKDGSDFEMYVEYGGDIMSYDVGKDEECVYHSLDAAHHTFVYEYIRSKVSPIIYSSLMYAMHPDKCDIIYSKKTRRHLFSYLLKYKTFIRVPSIKKQLVEALRTIHDTDIDMDDSLNVSYIGIAVTWDGKTEMSVYFRKT